MSKSAQRKKNQRLRKFLRELHLTPEMKKSFNAINKYIDSLSLSVEDKKKKAACTSVRRNRRKLVRLSESQNHRCCYCGCDTWHPDIVDYKTDRSHQTRATLEHLLPVSCGGTYSITNLVMACSECNNARGDKPVEHFMESIYSKEISRHKPKVKDVQELKEQRLKREKRERNLFKLLMIASCMFPEDYNAIMNNPNNRAHKTVFKGSLKPKTTRKHWIVNIRKRACENKMAA